MRNKRFIEAAEEVEALLDEIEDPSRRNLRSLTSDLLAAHARLIPAYNAFFGHFPIIKTDHPVRIWLKRARANNAQILAALRAGAVHVPTWEWRYKPILQAVADLDDLDLDSLREAVDLDADTVTSAVRDLVDDGLITGVDASSLAGFDMIALRLTPRGRVALGDLPESGEDRVGGDSLSESLRLRANEYEEDDPPDEYEYDVAVSYAGRDRPLVEEVVLALKSAGIKVWYDKDRTSDLWGEDLSGELSRIYSSSARFVMVFLSVDYTESDWTRFELETARRAARERRSAYILPVITSPEVPPIVGLPHTIAYVNLATSTPSEVAQLLAAKLDIVPD